jgi:hypothetical protein
MTERCLAFGALTPVARQDDNKVHQRVNRPSGRCNFLPKSYSTLRCSEPAQARPCDKKTRAQRGQIYFNQGLPCYDDEMMRALSVLVVALSLPIDFGNAFRVRWKPPSTPSGRTQTIEDVLQSYIDSKRSLSMVWDEHWEEDLPCGKPSRTGFVAKTATLAQSLTLRLDNADQKNFLPEQLPVYSGCQVCSVKISA